MRIDVKKILSRTHIRLFAAFITLLVGQVMASQLPLSQQKPTGLAAARSKEEYLANRARKAAEAPNASPLKKALSEQLTKELEQKQQALLEKKAQQPQVAPGAVLGQAPQQPVTAPEQVALAKIKQEKNTDQFTQSEAHLQLDIVKKEMEKFALQVPEDTSIKLDQKTPNEIVTPYLNIVAAALNKEVEFKNSHYALYHGFSSCWRVPQDIYKQLYAYYNPLTPVKDFVFIRFTDMPSLKAKDYLTEHITEFGGINDNIQEVRNVMISTNLAMFGGVGTPGECTWNYFIEPKSHKWPFPQNYQDVLTTFGLTYDIEVLTKEANELAEVLNNASKEQVLLQIFIPQDKIDEIAYLAWVIGFPAHPKSMALAEEIIGDKPRVGSITGPAVKSLMKKYKKEGESNPAYQELKAAVENGEFGLDAFLKIYRNTPWAVQNANDIQARLFITKDVLQNPNSGVKFFSYFVTPKEIQAEYLKKLDALVKKIIEFNEKK